MKDTEFASRASLVILIHANALTYALFLHLTVFVNTPAITDPSHLQETHFPPQATHECQVTLIHDDGCSICLLA